MSLYADHVKLEEKKEDIGEVLNGDQLVSGPYELDFLVDKDSEMLCRKKLTKDEVAQFRRAVDKDYYFEMYYDELPVWGLIGRVENREETEDTKYYKYFLYKHIHFDKAPHGQFVVMHLKVIVLINCSSKLRNFILC